MERLQTGFTVTTIEMWLFYRFCRGCVGAMLIYDITNSTSFEHLETWLDELQEQDADTVIMLLGNKCDLNESREVPAKMAEKFAGMSITYKISQSMRFSTI